MSEWKEYRLGDICQTNVRQYSTKENWQQFLYLDTGNITKGKIDEIQEFSSFKELPSRARRKVADGDIIYSSVRPNQEHYGYINNPPINLLVSTGFVVITPNTKIVNPVFLYNYLTRPEITNYLQAIGEQSVCTYPAIKPSDIEDLVVKIPSLDIQTKIASILSSFDDKIAINRRVCENLEVQAQSLFKHWFIDFAPFKDGKFVESDLGMIPEGWNVGKFGDLADLIKPSVKPQPGVVYSHYSIPAFDINQIPSHDKGESIKSNKFVIQDSVIMVSKLNPDHKRIWYVDKVKTDAICSTEFLPFYAKNKEHSAFVYCYLSNRHHYREIANGAKGTTNSHQRIDADAILSRDLAYDKETISIFCNIVGDLLKQKYYAVQESALLATLRDTLLPKLMSGKMSLD